MTFETKIAGVPVSFPFEPYPSQHALLESPTGTGKTLCLLCGCLAWRQAFQAKAQLDFLKKGLQDAQTVADHFQKTEDALNLAVGAEKASNVEEMEKGSKLKDNWQSTVDIILSQGGCNAVPRIIYTSRTHSQLSQAIGQLKKTIYKPKVIVLGSRGQLCVHPDVSKLSGAEQNSLCRDLCQEKKCSYRNNLKDNTEVFEQVEHNILDMEDLFLLGKKEKVCPFYLTKEIEPNSEVIFLPYNYVVNQRLRSSLGLDFLNDIIIFDEAHNLEQVASDSASFDLSSDLLLHCIRQVEKMLRLRGLSTISDSQSKPLQEHSSANGHLLLALLKCLYHEMMTTFAQSLSNADELVYPPRFLFELLAKVNITNKTFSLIVSQVNSLLGRDHSEKDERTSMTDFSNGFNAIDTFINYLEMLFSMTADEASAYHLICIYRDQISSSKPNKETNIILSFWCLDSSIVIKRMIKGIRCLVLTSGTLSPLSSFENAFQMTFPIQLENQHVVGRDQLWIGIVSNGPSGIALNSSYHSRSSDEYKRELGRSLFNFSLVIPGGMLCFFPSYQVMIDCITYWKNATFLGTSDESTTIWECLAKRKFLVVESKEEGDFHNHLRKHQENVKDRGGSLLFAVCRGRMSEGLNFSDDYARAVIIAGIPYPPSQERRVRMKRRFLCTVKRNSRQAQEWYRMQAIRAVNQAIGRVLRHKDDYGAVILCDERFSGLSHLSRWIQPFIKPVNSFGEAQSHLLQFFKSKRGSIRHTNSKTSFQEEREALKHVPKVPRLAMHDQQVLCATMLDKK
eukprot:jgi/Galph1/362/GphlegSOOS_G5110.1